MRNPFFGLIFAIVIVSVTGAARADSDAVACRGGILGALSFFAFSETDFADEYQQTNFLPSGLLDFAGDDAVLNATLDDLDQWDPINAERMRGALGELEFKPVKKVKSQDTGLDLPKTDLIFYGCHKKQVAVQDFDSRVVSYDAKVLERFDSVDRALFKLHEAFLRAQFESGEKDSKTLETRAREWIAAFYSSRDFNRNVIRNVIARSGKDPSETSDILFPWVRNAFTDATAIAAKSISQAIDAGFNPDFRLNNGDPILSYALEHYVSDVNDRGNHINFLDFPEILKTLLGRGANPNEADHLGRTAMHLAVYREMHRFNTFALLIQHGGDINSPWCYPGVEAGQYARTPLDLAILSKNRYARNRLEKLGAKTAQALDLKCSGSVAARDQGDRILDPFNGLKPPAF